MQQIFKSLEVVLWQNRL